jgi:hypothetical protein
VFIRWLAEEDEVEPSPIPLVGALRINLVLGKGGRGEVEQFVRLVGYEDVVRWGPNLAPRAAYVSSWMAKMG